MAASIGTFGQFGIGASAPVTQRIQYRDETLVKRAEIIDGNALRGTRSSSVELLRDGIYRVNGPVNLIPTANEWAMILAWIMGGTPSGSPTVTYSLGETTTGKTVAIDRVIKVFTYTGVKVDRATFRSSQNSVLDVGLDLVGLTESVGSAGTFPSLSLDVANGPFVFTDLALTVGGTTVQARELAVTIDNVIDKDRFFNSQTLTAANELDRVVTFSTSLPYGDYSALYTSATGAAGAAVVATFTNGGAVLTMTMPKVALPAEAPSNPGRQEIMLALSGRAYKSGSTSELTITLNPGP